MDGYQQLCVELMIIHHIRVSKDGAKKWEVQKTWQANLQVCLPLFSSRYDRLMGCLADGSAVVRA